MKQKGETYKKLRANSISMDAKSLAKTLNEKFLFTSVLSVPKREYSEFGGLNLNVLNSLKKEEIKEFSEGSSDEDRILERVEELVQLVKATSENSVFEETKENERFNLQAYKEKSETDQSLHLDEKINKINNNNFKEENDKTLVSIKKFEKITPFLDFVESSDNVQGNYQNYIYHTLKSFLQFNNINFTQALNTKVHYQLEENTNKKTSF